MTSFVKYKKGIENRVTDALSRTEEEDGKDDPTLLALIYVPTLDLLAKIKDLWE